MSIYKYCMVCNQVYTESGKMTLEEFVKQYPQDIVGSDILSKNCANKVFHKYLKNDGWYKERISELPDKC